MHQALKARDDAQHAEEAQQEAEARIDEQLYREREERERRRRLADRRAALSDEALATLRHRAEEALAANGVARTRLGYERVFKNFVTGEGLEVRLGVWNPDNLTQPTSPTTNGR